MSRKDVEKRMKVESRRQHRQEEERDGRLSGEGGRCHTAHARTSSCHTCHPFMSSCLFRHGPHASSGDHYLFCLYQEAFVYVLQRPFIQLSSPLLVHIYRGMGGGSWSQTVCCTGRANLSLVRQESCSGLQEQSNKHSGDWCSHISG